MVSDTQASNALDRALRNVPTTYAYAKIHKDEVVVWYDTERDDPDLLVQYVEQYTSLSYQGEKSHRHGDVAGLQFSP